MKEFFFFSGLLLTIGLPAFADPDPTSQVLRPAVVVFPKFHERSAIAQAAWIGYATGLAHLAMNSSEHPAPGSIEPSFDQEVAARRFMVSVWVGNLEDEEAPLDPYLEDLRRVEEAGFMRDTPGSISAVPIGFPSRPTSSSISSRRGALNTFALTFSNC